MSFEYKTIWGIHAGRTGDADILFLKKNVVALGWMDLGDLSKIETNREAFKIKIREVYPDKKPGAIPIDAGQLYRFLYEMKVGDLVVYPQKHTRKIQIGEVAGEYKYVSGLEYANQKPVKWLYEYNRTQFSQGALYEMGSAMSFFQIKNYADEIIAIIEGKKLEITSEDDETIRAVAEEIETNTHDFIIKTLARQIKGHPFEKFVGHLLNIMGYKTRLVPEGPDGGIDIVAHKDALGLEPPIIKVQGKSIEGNIGDPAVSSLYGKVGTGEYGLLVALGSFTRQAKNFAREKPNLRLIDGEELVELVLQHYDKLDSKYRGLIPLKKVYVPESIEKE